MTKTNSSYFYAEGDRVFVNNGSGIKECVVQAIEHISDIYDRFVLMSGHLLGIEIPSLPETVSTSVLMVR